MLLAPLVRIDHAVAAVGLDHGGDERDDVLADVADVGAVVHGKTVRQLHQRRRRPRFRRVDRAGDVIDRRGALRDRVRDTIVHPDGAGIGELRQVRLVLIQLRHQRLGPDGDRDHLAPLFAHPDRVDPHAGRRLREQPHVVVHFPGVRQLAGSAGDVTERRLRRRHGLRRREVVDDGRQEERLGRVLLDLARVLLVDRLIRIAARLRGGEVLLGQDFEGFLRSDLLRRERRDEDRGDEERQCASH
jgi:hypothetical protein